MTDREQLDLTATTLRRSVPPASAVSETRLRIVHSPDGSMIGMSYALDGRELVFGRSSEASETTKDQRMSRRHVRLSKGSSGYFVEDLGTTNGTFLDGKKVVGRQPLDGDIVSAGDTLMVVDRQVERELLPAGPDVDGSTIDAVVGISEASRALRESIATVSKTDGTVLLLGPTGAGKEVAARAVHEASARKGDFIPVNCAAIPSEIAEAELFGHKKGAFTGAEGERAGYFSLAERGTLFLDEVGDLSPQIQAKLLRVLEDKTIQPVGGGTPIEVDVRVVAATHVDLEGTGFRRDLLARIQDWVLRIPPLAERKADVLPLFNYFLRLDFPNRSVRSGTAEFYEGLLLHTWPMNARELRKLAKRIENLAGDGPFELSALPAQMQTPMRLRFDETTGDRESPKPPSPEDTSDHAPPVDILETALAEARGNVKLAATNNGWHRTQLYRWLKRYGIDPARFR